MSVNWTAHTVFGIKLRTDDLFEEMFVRSCDHEETKDEFCAKCGKHMWTKKSVCKDPDYEDGTDKLFGFPCIKRSHEDDFIYAGIIHSATEFENCEHYKPIPNIHLLQQLNLDIKSVLDNHKLWDESQF